MIITKSKFLSKVLRHNPELIGLDLMENGWVLITELVEKSKQLQYLSIEDITNIVNLCDKQRFTISNDGLYIKANQGHTADVVLVFTEKKPPNILYHGTATRFVKSIKLAGLSKRKRHHVHLSTNTVTAKNVGSRYGKPYIFTIDAEQMYIDGYIFYESDNGVWLTDSVPSKYLK